MEARCSVCVAAILLLPVLSLRSALVPVRSRQRVVPPARRGLSGPSVAGHRDRASAFRSPAPGEALNQAWAADPTAAGK